MRKSAFQAFFAAATLLGCSCGVARATVLTLEITETWSGGWVGDFSRAPQDYGDRVAAFPTASGASTYRYGSAESFSPKIEVGRGPPVADVGLWDHNNGDLNRVILPYNNGIGILEVILTANPIYEINHRGLDMRVWNVPIAPFVASGW